MNTTPNTSPELRAFLAYPRLQAHADRLLKVLGKVPVSRQGAAERGLDGKLIAPWISQWLRGRTALEKLRCANITGTSGGTP